MYKKFLVVGGSGFIGSHTANALLDKGGKVAIVDTAPLPANAKIAYHPISLESAELGQVFKKEKPEAVYHFAFSANHGMIKGPVMDVKDILGGMNLLEQCRKYGVRKIIFSSSGFLYGNAKVVPTPESEPVFPITPYMITKSILEQQLAYIKRMYGISYVVLRYATVYGPRQKRGAMSDYIAKLASGEQADIFGDGESTRDYVYIDDVVKANLLALNVKDEVESPIFNVGTGRETTLNELYNTLAILLGKEAKPNYLPEKPGEQKRYCLDYTKLKEAVGWKPEYDLEKGLTKRLKEEKLI